MKSIVASARAFMIDATKGIGALCMRPLAHAVARDDEIHTGVRRRFAFRPPRQASRIVQNLGRAMRDINKMKMRRSEIGRELVQCVATDERAGRGAYSTQSSV